MFCLWAGPNKGGGRFRPEEVAGIEENDADGCVDMIFEDYEHHGPMDGAKLFWSKITQVIIDQIV